MTILESTLQIRVRALTGATEDWEGYITSNVTGSSDTSIDVNDGTEWAEGDVGEFPDGGLFLVRSVATDTLTVKRGHLGSTDTTHTSGDVVRKNPSIYIKDIADSLDQTISGLWPYAWKAESVTVTPNTTNIWFNTAADVIDLISVYQIYNTYSLGIYGDKGGQKPIIFNHNLPSGLVASTKGLAFPNGFYDDTEDVSVTYRAKLTSTQTTPGTYDDFSDDISSEVIVHGAAARLSMAKEGSKILGEDVAEGELNVKAGDRLQLSQYLQNKYVMLLNNWNDELRRTAAPMGVLR